MQFFVRIIIPTLIPIILGFLFTNIDKSNSKEIIKNLTREHIVIRLPKAYLWVGCLDISFCVACICSMILFSNETATTWVWIVFILFALLGIVIIWETQFWKIDIYKCEDYFLYRTFFLKTHKVHYSDCISYKCGDHTIVLKTNKKRFYIDTMACNVEFLLTMLTQNKVVDEGNSKNLNKEHIIIRRPKAEIWVGSICTVLCIALLLLIQFYPDIVTTDKLLIQVFLLMLTLFEGYTIFHALVWKLEIFGKDDYFLFRTSTLKTYRIPYSDCINYKHRKKYIVLKTNRKTFYIDTMACNINFLITMLNKNKIRKIR